MKKYRILKTFCRFHNKEMFIIEERIWGLFWQGVGGDYSTFTYETFEEAEAKVKEYLQSESLEKSTGRKVIVEY
jgi:hypothetical protein